MGSKNLDSLMSHPDRIYCGKETLGEAKLKLDKVVEQFCKRIGFIPEKEPTVSWNASAAGADGVRFYGIEIIFVKLNGDFVTFYTCEKTPGLIKVKHRENNQEMFRDVIIPLVKDLSIFEDQAEMVQYARENPNFYAWNQLMEKTNNSA